MSSKYQPELMTEPRSDAEFVNAWRDAVDLIGAHYFMLKTPTGQCLSKGDMEPKVDFLRAGIGRMSSGEQVFARAVIQFYDDDIIKPHDRPTLPDIAARLDTRRLDILMRLMRHYSGW